MIWWWVFTLVLALVTVPWFQTKPYGASRGKVNTRWTNREAIVFVSLMYDNMSTWRRAAVLYGPVRKFPPKDMKQRLLSFRFPWYNANMIKTANETALRLKQYRTPSMWTSLIESNLTGLSPWTACDLTIDWTHACCFIVDLQTNFCIQHSKGNRFIFTKYSIN